MKYYIKATGEGGKSYYNNNFIYREGYNCHPNPNRGNYVCGEGRIHLANNIEIANKYVKNPEEYYLALPFEILAKDGEKIAVVDCWLWHIPNDIVLKYNKFKEPAKAEYKRIKDRALTEFEQIRDQAWDEFERITDQTWDDYERIIDQAWNDCERIRDHVLAEFERIINQAYETLIQSLNLIIKANPAIKSHKR